MGDTVSTGQLILAIGTLCSVIAILFRALATSWNSRLQFMEEQLERCQATSERAVRQTGAVLDSAERRTDIIQKLESDRRA